jgi:hypothetical protein
MKDVDSPLTAWQDPSIDENMFRLEVMYIRK